MAPVDEIIARAPCVRGRPRGRGDGREHGARRARRRGPPRRRRPSAAPPRRANARTPGPVGTAGVAFAARRARAGAAGHGDGPGAARHLQQGGRAIISRRSASICRSARGQLAPHDLPENIYRAVHTLCGSSKMAEARHGIRVTEPLNNYLRKVYESGRGLSDAGLALLADAVAAIENVVAHINESTVFLRGTAGAARSHPRAGGRARRRSRAAGRRCGRIDDRPRDGRSGGAGGLRPRDREYLQRGGDRAAWRARKSRSALGTSDRRNKTPVAELQRQLHTLKGGARMAGIIAMGDLSHELESLVIQLDGGFVSGDDRAHAVLQASLDELARMRDTVGAGSLPPPAAALIARIRALISGPAAEASAVAAEAARRRKWPRSARRRRTSRRRDRGPRTGPGVRPLAEEPARAESGEFSLPSLELSSAPVLPGRESAPVERTEMARVDADLARHHVEQRGRGQYFPRAPRPAGQLDRLQPGRACAYGHAPQGTVARRGNGDRGANSSPASGRRSAARRFRSAGVGPLLGVAAVLARTRRDFE